jgi:hypothetical protein
MRQLIIKLPGKSTRSNAEIPEANEAGMPNDESMTNDERIAFTLLGFE